ncbi:MAG TPA: hypothetical protein H9753_08890 [Candidatus Blautia merdavium]|uniref:Uncharacterized protein n=1 Tax=Candidatus Blautia merdavium TaxID=2838494 RepID=A0A9D2PMJ6_9FIRM|nr:hypothetical protein [Candidatus Blautia merdavium]
MKAAASFFMLFVIFCNEFLLFGIGGIKILFGPAAYHAEDKEGKEKKEKKEYNTQHKSLLGFLQAGKSLPEPQKDFYSLVYINSAEFIPGKREFLSPGSSSAGLSQSRP